ncbi:hypothetical protein SH668x_002004 [Planctomicrobium sp. SH668]|uniref:hypothetical protein n=1 Tax=Planctomicrobium sp. SH668 TaxID=3448126 RepID=UPI003F5B02CE
MYDVVFVFNACEAIFWFILAAIIASCLRPVLQVPVRALLVLCLVLFGVSDLVEMTTVAWWRPLWLLFLKAACLCGLIAGTWIAWKQNQRVKM